MKKVGTIVNIRECRDQGLTKQATALRLGLDRKTVAKYWDGPTDDPEKPRYKQRAKLTDSYLEYIMERLDKFPELTAERIYREIKKKGSYKLLLNIKKKGLTFSFFSFIIKLKNPNYVKKGR